MPLIYNRHKVDELPVRIPKEFTPEDRGFDACCDCEFMAIASSTSTDPWKNSINSGWYFGESTAFVLKREGIVAAYQPATQSFANDTSAKYYTINWKDVLDSDGTGCYTVEASYDIAGITGTVVVNTYRLFEYSQTVVEGHVMLMSVFNNANEKEGINFTNSQVVDCIIFKGDFNDFQPNTQIRNNQWSDDTLNSVIRENLKRWTLVVSPATQCLIDRLIDLHLLAENNVYVSDYNRYAYDSTMLHKSVIVSQEGGGAKVTNFPASNKKGLTCEFELKIRKDKAHFGSISASGEPLPNIPLIPSVVMTGGASVNAQAINSESTTIATGIVTSVDPEINIPDTVVTVEDELGNTIESASLPSGVPGEITLSVAIAYDRVKPRVIDTTTYFTGDIGYHLTAGTYDYSAPVFPYRISRIDSAITPWILAENNSFGNTRRFTNTIGALVWDGSDGSIANYVIDHLTGLGWVRQTSNTGTALGIYPTTTADMQTACSNAESSTFAGFLNWRIPTDYEVLETGYITDLDNTLSTYNHWAFQLQLWSMPEVPFINTGTYVWTNIKGSGTRAMLAGRVYSEGYMLGGVSNDIQYYIYCRTHFT